ncbi:Hypothetical protein R9X50_00767500 [Acrodontium crateriforme]|uniref:Protein kinase domain-containing protein n=1 Tax=Acrodontium crateriforme TaxID=150365 RepID=A0AAQ3MBK8_9PEZI|nr:Hypothetical protein R9X50_00767500 [Acrodontium crateriforme]
MGINGRKVIVGAYHNSSRRRCPAASSTFSQHLTRSTASFLRTTLPIVQGSFPYPNENTKARYFSSAMQQSAMLDGYDVVGQSGRAYKIAKLLQDKGIPYGHVYLATHGNSQYVLKEIPQDWTTRIDIYQRATHCPCVRLPVDTVPKNRILVFEYSSQNFLSLVQENLPLATTKRILKSTLEGIVALHEIGILHNDIKANNILIHTKATPSGSEVQRVELTDLEDAVHLEPNQVLKGAKLGNWMWRSPEAHAKGPMEKPSDIFAFGIVCIYALTKAVIFAVDNPSLSEDDKIATVLFRQMSYFSADAKESFHGLLEYLGNDNPARDIFEAVEEGFGDVPRDPFMEWQHENLCDDAKDMVSKMCRLDPRNRITAKEALGHRWWKNI